MRHFLLATATFAAVAAATPSAHADMVGAAAGAKKSPVRWSAGRRSVRSAGFANLPDRAPRLASGATTPFVRRVPELRTLRRGVSQTPGASRRSILVQKGKGKRAAPRPHREQGRRSVG